MALSPKQQRFVDEYLIDLNATQAAIRAGYSANGAEVQGHRLLTNAKVQAAVSAAQASRSERVAVDADWVLQRLAAEAEADIADLYDDADALKPVRDWPLIWRKGLVAGVEVEEIYEGFGKDRLNIGRLRKVRLSERIKRIELIGKHVGVQAFREQVGLSDPNGGPIQTEVTVKVDDDTIERISRRLLGEQG